MKKPHKKDNADKVPDAEEKRSRVEQQDQAKKTYLSGNAKAGANNNSKQ